MTARLPTPGGDDNQWGDILNDFLDVSHASDGSLNDNVVGTDQIQANAVTNPKLASSIQTSLSSADSSVQSVNGKTPSSGDVTLAATDIGANGVASLDANGHLLTAEFPSGVVSTSGQQNGQVPEWNGSAWVPVTSAQLAQSGQIPSQNPVPAGTAANVGSLAEAARADHIHASYGLFGWLGDGQDGVGTFDGTTTPTGVTKQSSTLYIANQDLHYVSVSGLAGITLDMSGYQLYVRGAIVGPSSGTFTITTAAAALSGQNQGTAPGDNLTGGNRAVTLGVGWVGASGGTGGGGQANVRGDTSTPVSSQTTNATSGSGGSGASGAGGPGYGTTNNTGLSFTVRRFVTATTGMSVGFDAAAANINGGGSAGLLMGGYGGGSGGGDGTNVGGAGGGGGNILIINTMSVSGNVAVSANGGDGGTATVGNCGGGGGGTGGVALLNALDLSAWTGAVSAAGGAGGSGSGSGASGTGGATGIARATTWL